MIVTRWKMLVGVVSVSLGGLAAAGQCSKSDSGKVRRSDDTPPVSFEAPKVPSGSPTVVAPMLVPSAPTAVAPVLPDLPPPPAKPEVKPAAQVSDFHEKRPTLGVTPVVSFAPDLDMPIKPAAPMTPPVPAAAPVDVQPSKPVPIPPSSPAFTAVTQSSGVALPPTTTTVRAELPPSPEPAIDPVPTKVVPTISTATPGAVKYRIVLRVGEGEPSFEVRMGDELLMKVVCEKVDVKSPEKAQGLSAVTATGRVRFVGFGAEGSCDQLSFLAGTGEVSMNGAVKVQVKDKLGRVDSELMTEKMHYKIDAGTMPIGIKP